MQNVLPIIDKLRSSIEGWSSNSIYYICLFVVIPIIIFISITAVILVFRRINKLEKDQDSSHMREMNAYIIRGAKLFLKDEGKMLAVITLVLFVPVGLNGTEFLDNAVLSFMLTSLIFFIGSGSSYVASYIGMLAATKANILVVESSKKDPEEGFKIAYYGGMITGILNITMFVIGIWLIFILTGANIYMMVSFDFGASVSALLAQVGGGIYTKSADMGADLAGKYEMGISEDNPNNPAIIADLVGDNVGDCAGRGADLFESASSDSIGGMLLGLTLFLYSGDPIFVITNLTLVSLGTL